MGTISSSGSTIVTANYGRFRRRMITGIALLVTLLVGGGIGLGVFLGTDAGAGDDAVAVPDAVLPDLGDAEPVLAALSADAPVPDPAALEAALTPLVTGPPLGPGTTAQVVDVATGEVLYDRDAGAPLTPASTAKLLTATAALTTLDPAATFETRVVAGSAPGEVVLVGGGDPTLSRTEPSQSYPGAPTMADLATQVVAALPAGTAVTRVVVDSSLFSGPLTASGWGPGDAPSSYAAPITATAVDGARVSPGALARSGQPGLDAGAALADALGAPGAAVVLGQAPAGARTLGTVESAPVARLVEQALSQSDNVLAEVLARHVALARDEAATFDGAAQAVVEALDELGLDVTGITLADGSGLSRENVVTAELLTAVVGGAADGSLGEAAGLLPGLPVAGYDGTLADRGDDDPATAPGTVRAKTGTLLGVNALAGTVVTADGRLLAFAVVADEATGSELAAEAALDEFAATLAACGC
ncbi:D-alanyl-D-alanine carboxypeptidase/D-alanyl-D-alanine-endopeptidase [Blastococcus sp. MG754426]|uniref:D-alanyl-D-alanine carboxypeptidase/D-alanyl-D-alanine endopeptidase n=1 Tax=unclassified Blastococcus TaxID=2619396 RepID=UPI001EEFD633|nr:MULTISPECIES: D-alanyl-D-alanine carboxypeptidase/D-alanyl-D-alanine-endopeptidase [unclassified Blastococcus]MCF6506236.1 D-alanyl-D-alanine carboxypeptidase/D-alanyl-D-alanine-endopeptidase [Blastococcus sp. MG754426]MCF6510386.1 D-alanyl-D-alanine carboxypeptidase/D-alanyl-D-alanine-endopeptidase [Blastococcus sp. MG754427]MCF6736415.1 D-alanyl-D-alanine carboxypeptidase/D-alanyl-D-alanine-endopeptidase [Blastococcus sp. KM273129]